jgi:predicted metal-dependent hydrolase
MSSASPRHCSKRTVRALAGRWQVTRFLFGEPGIFRKLGPRYRDWYRPGFHPWDYDNLAKLREWRQQFG